MAENRKDAGRQENAVEEGEGKQDDRQGIQCAPVSEDSDLEVINHQSIDEYNHI